MSEQPDVVILVVRDPDRETELYVEGAASVREISVDLGGSFDGRKDFPGSMEVDEAWEWLNGYREEVADLPEDSEVRGRVENLMNDLEANLV